MQNEFISNKEAPEPQQFFGGWNSETADSQDYNEAVKLSDFIFEKELGRGGFGKVWSARSKRHANNKRFAIKQISKEQNLRETSVRNLLNELDFMKRIKSDFVVNLNYALQEDRNLYLVMDLMTGGDLWQQLKIRNGFREPVCKFFIACLI